MKGHHLSTPPGLLTATVICGHVPLQGCSGQPTRGNGNTVKASITTERNHDPTRTAGACHARTTRSASYSSTHRRRDPRHAKAPRCLAPPTLHLPALRRRPRGARRLGRSGRIRWRACAFRQRCSRAAAPAAACTVADLVQDVCTARGTTDVGARAWLAMKTCVAGTRADIPTLDGRCHQVEIVPQLVSRRRTANLPPSSPVSWPNLRDHRGSRGVHKSGTGDVCGPAECLCADPSCAPDPTITKSDPRLLLAAVRASDPQFSEQVESVCTTCDPMLMDTPSAMRSKFDCLQRHWSDPTMATPTRAELDGRMRAMVALAADHLTPAERAAAREHFGHATRQTALACEPALEVAVPPTCAPDVANTLRRDLEQCGASRPSTRRAGPAAWVAADECIAVLDRVTRAHDATSPEHACVDAELTQTRETVQHLVRGAMAAPMNAQGSARPQPRKRTTTAIQSSNARWCSWTAGTKPSAAASRPQGQRTSTPRPRQPSTR